MSTASRLGWLFGLEIDEPAVFECRHCGTNVEHTDSHCPTCGSDGIAIYDV